MLSAILAASLVTQVKTDMMCPVMTNRPTTGRMAVDYDGARIAVCCDQCVRTVWQNPAKYVKEAMTSGQNIGWFLFDPLNGLRIDPKDANSSIVVNGFYYFSRTSGVEEQLKAFANSDKRSTKNEMLSAWGTDKVFETPGQAAAYVDGSGYRFYLSDPADKEKVLNALPTIRLAPNPIKGHPVPIPGIKW